MPSARPNFILFITDRQRADHLGCYGHPVPKTPHIGSIAERGVAMEKPAELHSHRTSRCSWNFLGAPFPLAWQVTLLQREESTWRYTQEA